ncbi:hypothetical protein MMC28_006947 [Mycoblastus sanguinarius]|nr:hypothetical protein [Mycoblastus sanguinarius]
MRSDRVRSVEKWPGFTNRAPDHFARVNELLEDIVTYLLSDRADVNTSIFSIKRFLYATSTGYTLQVALEETPLSFMEVAHSSRGVDPLGILDNVLRSHGGVETRRCHFVHVEDYGLTPTSEQHHPHLLPDRWYRLSPLQSDYLCDIMHSYPKDFCHPVSFPDHTNPEILRRIDELLSGLTEDDLVASPDGKAQSSDKNASLASDEQSSEEEAKILFAESEER